MLAGQICDGIATPIVGYLSDKFNSKYGKKIYLFKVKELLGMYWAWF